MQQATQVPTQLDKFDFSSDESKAKFLDAITNDLDQRGRDIMFQRLGLCAHTGKLTLGEVAKIFKTNADEIMSIESQLADSLTRRAVPLKVD